MQRVLVLGVPRSGTTWVAEVLGRCDGATYVHEPDGVHEPFGFVARSGLPAGFCLAAGESNPKYERLWSGAFAGGAKAATPRDHLARRLYAGVTTAQRASVRNGGNPTPRLWLASKLAQPRVAHLSATAVVAKSVDAALCAEWIADKFHPEVVVVQRDLRSVLASWITLNMAGPQLRNYDALANLAQQRWGVELPTFDAPVVMRSAAVCSVWSVALRASARQLGWTVLPYEEVALDPEHHLRNAAEHCGLGFGDAAQTFLLDSNRAGEGYSTQRVAGSTIDTWKAKLDDDQIRAIETVVECFPESLR